MPKGGKAIDRILAERSSNSVNIIFDKTYAQCCKLIKNFFAMKCLLAVAVLRLFGAAATRNRSLSG